MLGTDRFFCGQKPTYCDFGVRIAHARLRDSRAPPAASPRTRLFIHARQPFIRVVVSIALLARCTTRSTSRACWSPGVWTPFPTSSRSWWKLSSCLASKSEQRAPRVGVQLSSALPPVSSTHMLLPSGTSRHARMPSTLGTTRSSCPRPDPTTKASQMCCGLRCDAIGNLVVVGAHAPHPRHHQQTLHDHGRDSCSPCIV